MSTQNFNSIVSKSEADALKDMIFKRVRERAENLNKETQNTYTSSVHNEIMEIARNSFVSDNNPFSIKQKEIKKEEALNITHSSQKEIIEESKRKAEELKAQIIRKNEAAKTDYFVKTMEENMQDAQIGLTKKHTFIGALEFLNSQASVSLIQKRGKNFNAIA